MRAVFSKSYMLLELLNEENPDMLSIETHFRVMEGRLNELINVDQEIYDNILLDEEQEIEDALIKEMESVDKYHLKYYEFRAGVDSLNHKTQDSEYTVRDGERSKHVLCLPKLELIKYGGEVSGWISFRSQFQSVGADNTLRHEEKFQDLIPATSVGSRGRSIFESFPLSGENYKRALQILPHRFERKDLVESYTRELLKLVINNLDMQLLTYDRLETQLRALESLGIPKTWQRYTSILAKTLKEQVDRLVTFLKAEVEGEECVSIIHSKPVRDNLKVAKKKYWISKRGTV
ncbi:hypothetical protein PR048_004737 [Dryococelus australis]|uniref:Uncharacterized protein n=1 Tax=Dryococelus australis TaxID=614101 RepID=A0ABQ9I688_9NEOP|nr:hypothetical protein PR048_004737 [Dryococelus australis]